MDHLPDRGHGLLGAARRDFEDYQALDFSPDWWELAHTQDGALAGVAMGAKNPVRPSSRTSA